jgi:SAM-dependent methyltransferase
MTPQSPRYRWHRLVHATRRRRWRDRIERLYGALVESWDQDAFRERFRPHWDPFAGTRPAKFLDVETWLREAVFRYLLLNVDDSRSQRILDIGAGTGYFLLVCRHQGHQPLGLDLPDEPLYDECFDFFALPRMLHRIEAMQALPESGEPLDLITAFMTCFNYEADGRPWGEQAWRFLLSDLRERLNPAGRVVLKFNLEPQGNRFYGPEVRRALGTAAGFRCRFFLDYALLQAR